jgi:hypothetical protein
VSGIALALHLPAGRHLVVGSTNVRRPQRLESKANTLALLTLLAAYVAEPALSIFGEADEKLPEFTKRELECLKWRVEGKTAWETGMLLNLSESRITKILPVQTTSWVASVPLWRL